MKLQLSAPAFNPGFRIKHTDKLFFLGSCFAEKMSGYFVQRKFDVLENPFGVLYNPISIANSVEQIVSLEQYKESDFHFRHGLYYSWNHHSNLGEPKMAVLKNKLNQININSKEFIEKSNVVFITLGTAWVYYHKKKEIIVANNLKASANLFEKKLLSIQEIVSALQKTIKAINSVNPNARFLLTVSPVRHSKQGLAENNRSKARLLEAAHLTCEQNEFVQYLPSYELVVDVLRDYRFFEVDLVHPNKLASDFIFEYLTENLLATDEIDLLEDLYKLHLAVSHKIRHTNSEEATDFRKAQLKKIEMLGRQFPYLKLDNEKHHFENL
jgi:hypothetical protein